MYSALLRLCPGWTKRSWIDDFTDISDLLIDLNSHLSSPLVVQTQLGICKIVQSACNRPLKTPKA